MSRLESFLAGWRLTPDAGSPQNCITADIELDRLLEVAAAAKRDHAAALAMLTALDLHPQTPRFRLVLVLHVPGEPRYLVLRAPVIAEKPEFPSLTAIFANANWPEREIRDMFGLHPTGHPDPRPLVWKGGWPRDLAPLRKDVRLDRAYPVERTLFPPPPVEGEGVCEVPVGPIHAGIIEPGHFRIQVVGDTVLTLDAQMFYCHRGIEKMAEGRNISSALLLAERQCGTCSVSNALSYCLAVERAAGTTVPARARSLRLVVAELERIYNHVNDIAAIPGGVGFAFLGQQGLRVKEEMQRRLRGLCGHRFLRNVLVPGGMRQDFSDADIQRVTEEFEGLWKDLRKPVGIALDHSIFLDRGETTGYLTTKNAVALRAVGHAARASNIAADTRLDHPYDGYAELGSWKIPTRPEGDVMARFRQRIAELDQSFEMLRQTVKQLPAGPVRADIARPRAGSWGLGASESARGENLLLIRFAEGGTIDRYAVRTASYCNWPCIPTTVRGNIVPDFPLINKSFELCYADVDR
ncbi:MAG TPA: NADH-quinone oxidoreductase subunit C [Candidatus Ozemobacteraceae bacterium]|nr:NADH-quinone oxidoreductase subunit C [Candidatus Ozemobacteraceae bacterium]